MMIDSLLMHRMTLLIFLMEGIVSPTDSGIYSLLVYNIGLSCINQLVHIFLK